jgi:hypothetical protein
MTMTEAYARLPELARAALSDHARRRLLLAPEGRRAYVARVLQADPGWTPRRHVMRGLGPVELAAAREADARQDALVAKLRKGAARGL